MPSTEKIVSSRRLAMVDGSGVLAKLLKASAKALVYAARVPVRRQISAEFRPSQNDVGYGGARCRRCLQLVGKGEYTLIESGVFEA